MHATISSSSVEEVGLGLVLIFPAISIGMASLARERRLARPRPPCA